MNYATTSLDRLAAGDKIAVRRHNSDGSLRFLLNGEDCGIGVPQVPKKLIPWIELYGSTVSVSVVSVSQTAHPSPAGKSFTYCILGRSVYLDFTLFCELTLFVNSQFSMISHFVYSVFVNSNFST